MPAVPVPALMDAMQRVVYAANLDLTTEEISQYAVEWEAAGFSPNTAREWLIRGAREEDAGTARKLQDAGVGFRYAFLTLSTPGRGVSTSLFHEVDSGRLSIEQAKAIVSRETQKRKERGTA